MKKITLVIEGMSCSGCSNGLEKYLNKQEEVISASVNLVLKTATITYTNKIGKKELEKYIEEAGFKSVGEEIQVNKDKKTNITPLIIYGILAVLIMYITMAHSLKLPEIINMEKYPKQYAIVLLLLTTPFIIYAFDIIKSGIKSLIHLMPNMDTLITLGVFSSYIYSSFSVIMVLLEKNNYIHSIYFESAIFVIYFIKLGRFIVGKNRDKTEQDIKDLVRITPNKSHLKTEEGYIDVTIDEIKKEDLLICLPGEKIAVDGEIVEGSTTIDESLITGESQPVFKEAKSKVIAGSINHEGKIIYKAERIGKETTVSEIVRLVVQATSEKNKITRIVDKICSYFVPTIVIIAIITFIINLIMFKDVSLALIRLSTVLIIACPCSLGLATPLALVVSISNSAKKGILIKNSEVLEVATQIDTVVFDKTGTLTYGLPTVSKIIIHVEKEEKEILELLASIEKYSNHPLAKGINNYAKKNKIKVNDNLITEDLVGYGVKAKDDENVYYACNKKLLKKLDISNSYEDEELLLSQEGNTVIYLVRNKKIIALIGLKDTIRKESKRLIENLKERNINVLLLSGDNEVTTMKIANDLNLSKEQVYSGLSPKEKNKKIKEIISEGHKVMMVGDGINDAPSLKSATIGVSLNSGTEIASNAASIVITNNNLMKINDIILISKKTKRIIKENLFWAFIYNLLMIPLATGLITKITINPMIACIAMIVSSLTVTINSLRLKQKK